MSTSVGFIPVDPELLPTLEALSAQRPVLSAETLPMLRRSIPPTSPLLAEGTVVTTEHTVATADGALLLTTYRRADHTGVGPGLYWIHGGGLISGDRLQGADMLAEWVAEFDLVAVSVEYRLAPEHPFPAAFDDCYAGLQWTSSQAEHLGIDAQRIIVAGASAGGNLAAAITIAARDHGAVDIYAQLLMCPMLDDRDDSISARQHEGVGTWSRENNRFGWQSYLGDHRGSADIPVYASPARLTDFRALPPTYLDVGSAEVFRDEVVTYASALWAAGVQAELHVWAGGFHGFDGIVPSAAVSRQSRETRTDWLARALR